MRAIFLATLLFATLCSEVAFAKKDSKAFRSFVTTNIEKRLNKLKKTSSDSDKFFTLANKICTTIKSEIDKLEHVDDSQLQTLNQRLYPMSREYPTHLNLCLELTILETDDKRSYLLARMLRLADKSTGTDWAAMWVATSLQLGLGAVKSKPKAIQYLDQQIRTAKNARSLKMFRELLRP